MIPTVDEKPQVTTKQLNEWLKLPHWTDEQLAAALHLSVHQIRRRIGGGKIVAWSPFDDGHYLIKIDEVKRLLNLE